MEIYKLAKDRTTKAGRNSTYEQTWVMVGVNTSIVAHTLLATVAAPSVIVEGITLDQVFPAVNELNDDMWEGTLGYSHRGGTAADTQTEQLGEPGQSEFSFDFSPENIKLQYSLNQTKFGASAPDMGGAINVDAKGNPQGVDIIIPRGTYAETHIFDEATVTQAWIAQRGKMVGKVSSSAFRGYDAGELLLTRFSGRKRGAGDWSCNFGWNISENKTSFTVAGITGVTKPGWDHLWVAYEKEVDATAKRLRPKAIGVYVDEVYERVSMDTIFI